ncbi:hypothetical protein NSP_1000 [Nodularia spumigena CCY9414]|nr:hypothetical protein NSP_1000 [Nodularia spumigena CCY9414]
MPEYKGLREQSLFLTGLTQKLSQTLIPLCPLRLVWFVIP